MVRKILDSARYGVDPVVDFGVEDNLSYVCYTEPCFLSIRIDF